MRSVHAFCCGINEIFNKTKKCPLPYCNDLMSVLVAPGHVGGKVLRSYQSLGGPPPASASSLLRFPAPASPPVLPRAFRPPRPVFVFKARNQRSV